MNKQNLVNAFIELGNIFNYIIEEKKYNEIKTNLSQNEYNSFVELINTLNIYNGWFTKESIYFALTQWGTLLHKNSLQDWLSNYQYKEGKTIAVITAGNIPMVGFHDVVCVLLSGCSLKLKCSSSDDKIIPKILEVLCALYPPLENRIEIINGALKNFDAVIATGSNNSSNYFEQYFSKFPNIIRKNRTSVAMVEKTISKEELELLGEDIFTYFGLGCRNVSKVFFPNGFDLDKFFKGIFKFQHVIYNHKYANNYDYQKAIHLMNQDKILDNGFLLIKEDKSLHAPLSMLYFEFYNDKNQVLDFVETNKNQIQVFIDGKKNKFGSSQKPSLNDFADNINIMQFIQKL